MKKQPFSSAVRLVVVTIVLTGSAQSQQPPAENAQKPSTPSAQAAPAAKENAPVAALSTPKDKASYALGMSLGNNLHRQGADVDPAILFQGLKDSLAAGKTLLTEDEARRALAEFQSELRKKQQEQARLLGEENKKKGDAFLATNKVKEGVVTLPSGLQYKILQEGAGPKPKATDEVVCNYRGTLIDSTEFDSSYKRGQPSTFPVNRVIKGWQEALQLMPVGSKWQLFVPPELAYGERGGGSTIGPNSTLVFEIELLSIKEKPSAEPPVEKPADKPPEKRP
jgi:FKBP-type peptidyl-prolyl cis-trans isomerase